MPYVTPSVLVYQQLEEAGGVLNTTPDLEACIIGPMYNVITVDPSDQTTLDLAESISIANWDTEQAAIILADGTRTGFHLPLPSTIAGQVPVASSVSVHMSDTFVDVNEFTMELNFAAVDRSLVTATGANALFSAALPDGTGEHAQVGDKVIYRYNPTGGVVDGITDVIVETSIIDVESDTTFRIADALPADPGLSTTAVFHVYRLYSYLQVISGATQFETTEVGSDSRVNLLFTAVPYPNATTPANYGFLSGTTHVGYKALRTDKSTTLLNINSPSDSLSKLGAVSVDNPLALGVSIALANTTTSIRAMSVASDDLIGYTAALDYLEGEEGVYYMTPLTQETAILSAVTAHVQQLSTPVEGLWRTAIVNTEIRESKDITGNADLVITDGVIVDDGAKVYFDSASSDFISDQVTATDTLVITASSVPALIGSHEVSKILNSNRLQIDSMTVGNDGATASFHILRNLTRTQQAEEVAATSEVFNSNRVWHIQPDIVGVDVDSVTTYLPGYYLCCGLAGMGAGFPVQQGFTNIGVAGITDLQNSNFYFSRANLGTMAEKGTCLFVQATQGGLPFCRHELTTDVSVLEYREIVKVKNWDFLSYYYKDKLKPFIGTWNITPDTLTSMRQTVIASSELLTKQKLPKIGPPLLSYDLRSLEQDTVNKDNVNVDLKIEIVTPNNYTNVYLVI